MFIVSGIQYISPAKVPSNSPSQLHFYLVRSFQTKKSHTLLEPPDDTVLRMISINNFYVTE
jgi:hypothetical protein